MKRLAAALVRYWIGVSVSGTTARVRTIPAPTSAAANRFTGILGSSATSTFNIVGTANLVGGIGGATGASAPATTALPTTLIGDTAPVACVY